MTTTRKDYEAIAKILRDPENTTRLDFAFALAEYFEQDNPNFDWGRFMGAVQGCHVCGVAWGH